MVENLSILTKEREELKNENDYQQKEVKRLEGFENAVKKLCKERTDLQDKLLLLENDKVIDDFN